MKKLYIITCLLYIPMLVDAQADDAIKTIKFELLKPLPWMINGGYILEPGFMLHHKNVAYGLNVGYNNINRFLENQYDYNNKGWYGQAVVQFRVNSGENKVSGFYLGLSGNIAHYKESGAVIFEGDQYDDYHVYVEQNNTTFGISWLASGKINVNDRFFTDLTFRFSHFLNEFNQTNHPVYYVPGMGIIFGASQRDAPEATLGFSIKVGYIL